jgi:hypothetical protein
MVQPSYRSLSLSRLVGDDEVGYVGGILLHDFGNGDALDVVDASRSRAL